MIIRKSHGDNIASHLDPNDLKLETCKNGEAMDMEIYSSNLRIHV